MIRSAACEALRVTEVHAMSAHLVAGSAPARLHTEPKVVEPALLRLLRTVAVWMERSRQRRALAELADANDHLLADLGISQAEARDEAAKPFWAFSRAGEVDRASLLPTTGRKVLMRVRSRVRDSLCEIP
jgi:uncharacterized protein YjiS (DUF1127 family)